MACSEREVNNPFIPAPRRPPRPDTGCCCCCCCPGAGAAGPGSHRGSGWGRAELLPRNLAPAGAPHGGREPRNAAAAGERGGKEERRDRNEEGEGGRENEEIEEDKRRDKREKS